MFRSILSLLAFAAILLTAEAYKNSGYGTAYSDPYDMNATGENMCEFDPESLDKKWQVFYGAMNEKDWDTDGGLKGICGKCIRVMGVKGETTPGFNIKPVIVKIVDQCPSWACDKGNVDFSTAALKAITGYDWDKKLITWEYTDCSGGSGSGGEEQSSQDGKKGNQKEENLSSSRRNNNNDNDNDNKRRQKLDQMLAEEEKLWAQRQEEKKNKRDAVKKAAEEKKAAEKEAAQQVSLERKKKKEAAAIADDVEANKDEIIQDALVALDLKLPPSEKQSKPWNMPLIDFSDSPVPAPAPAPAPASIARAPAPGPNSLEELRAAVADLKPNEIESVATAVATLASAVAYVPEQVVDYIAEKTQEAIEEIIAAAPEAA